MYKVKFEGEDFWVLCDLCMAAGLIENHDVLIKTLPELANSYPDEPLGMWSFENFHGFFLNLQFLEWNKGKNSMGFRMNARFSADFPENSQSYQLLVMTLKLVKVGFEQLDLETDLSSRCTPKRIENMKRIVAKVLSEELMSQDFLQEVKK